MAATRSLAALVRRAAARAPKPRELSPRVAEWRAIEQRRLRARQASIRPDIHARFLEIEARAARAAERTS